MRKYIDIVGMLMEDVSAALARVADEHPLLQAFHERRRSLEQKAAERWPDAPGASAIGREHIMRGVADAGAGRPATPTGDEKARAAYTYGYQWAEDQLVSGTAIGRRRDDRK